MSLIKKALIGSLIYGIYRVMSDNTTDAAKTRKVLAESFETWKPTLATLLDEVIAYLDASRSISNNQDRLTLEQHLEKLKSKIEAVNSKTVASELAKVVTDTTSYLQEVKQKFLSPSVPKGE